MDIREFKDQIEKKNPLILNLTNHVTMGFMADMLLALGASPIMSESSDDALELLDTVDAVNINIGTLNTEFIHLINSIAVANACKKPIILDPVGAGASTIRKKTCETLLPLIHVLKGNAGEILSLYNGKSNSKGVDSSVHIEDSIDAAYKLALGYNITVAVTGVQDFITNPRLNYCFEFGHPIMTKKTGIGCVLSSIIAAFCAVEDNYFLATATATAFFGLCAELAVEKSSNLGFFNNYFLDMIHNPDYDYIQKKLNGLNSKLWGNL